MKLFERYAHALLSHPRWVLLCCLGLGLLTMSGLKHLQFTTDYRAFFSKANPELATLEAIEKNFARAETVIVALESTRKDQNIFNADTLALVRGLSDQWSQLPYARGVSSLSTYHVARAEDDTLSASPLLPDDLSRVQDWRSLRQQALQDERLLHGAINPLGSVTGIFFYFELPHRKPAEELKAITTALESVVAAQLQQHPKAEVRVRLAGVVYFDQAMQAEIIKDMLLLYPACFMGMGLLLFVFFRSVSAVLAVLGSIGLAVGGTLGMAGWLGIVLTPASLIAGIIILTIAIADCVHLLTTYSGERARGQSVDMALQRSLRYNALAIFLTTVTNVFGFITLNFADSPPYRDLGNLVAIGTVAAWLLSISFLPAWLKLFPPKVHAGVLKQSQGVTRVVRGLMPHWRWALALAVALSAISIWGVKQNQFGDNYVEFFKESLPFRQDTVFINENLTGMQYMEYGFDTQQEGGIYDPAYLAQMDEFVTWLRQQPEVVKVSSLTDLLKQLNQAMHNGDKAFYRIPSEREAVAQYLLFFEMSLPQGNDLNNLVKLDKSALRLTIQFSTLNSDRIRDFNAKANQWQQQHWPKAMYTNGSGISLLFANIGRRNFQSMFWGTLTTCLLIGSLLVWISRSFKLGLISMLPNLLPMLWGFGLWGVLVGKMGMSLAVVASLTLGIVVDDTLHVFAHYGAARRRGLSVTDALMEAYADVGVAVWVTSTALVGGFCVLMLSSFILTIHLGALTALILLLAMLAEFWLVPPLLLWLDKDR
jgi:hypothetical protein